jgi:NADPH-dependent ferric siderophore reductase
MTTIDVVPQVSRFRHELKRRLLTVAAVERMPPNMVRIVLTGNALQGFTSLGFDDHIKLFFPVAGQDPAAAPAMRDFTPRHFDTSRGELWIDFYLHEGGPAAGWATQARVGQTLLVAGPKGSSVISAEGIEKHLLIGDETALPAISRRLEELPSTTSAEVIVEIESGVERPTLRCAAALNVTWVVRNTQRPPAESQLLGALRTLDIHSRRCFAWIATESRTARAIRKHLCEERGFDKKWIKAAGYWQVGAEGAHDNIPEDA